MVDGAVHAPRPHLFLQILNVGPVVGLHLARVLHDDIRVRLWVPSHADAKIVTILFPAISHICAAVWVSSSAAPDKLDQVQCTPKAALDLLERRFALGRVAAQRQNVAHARRLGLRVYSVRKDVWCGTVYLFQSLLELLDRHVGTCEVHHGLHAHLHEHCVPPHAACHMHAPRFAFLV